LSSYLSSIPLFLFVIEPPSTVSPLMSSTTSRFSATATSFSLLDEWNVIFFQGIAFCDSGEERREKRQNNENEQLRT
jgi:hypothetical protein